MVLAPVFKVATLVAACIAWVTVVAQVIPSKSDVNAARARIVADAKAEKKTCQSLGGNAAEVCIKVAEGREEVALAELEHSRSAKPADQLKIRVAKVEAAYAVAHQKCEGLRGDARELCSKEAKTARTKGIADAKLEREIAEAKADAEETKREADYQLAVARCGTLEGNSKMDCLAGAMSQHGGVTR